MSRVEPEKRKASERTKDFDEVITGYTTEQAVEEASRCLQCKNPMCSKECPANVDIPGFIRLIKEGKTGEALELIKSTNSLPGVCGRVCPQEVQCEAGCILASKGSPVSIGLLERFAADNSSADIKKVQKKLGKKIAVVGSGPASITCAADLASKGYNVTIFEALHKPGGVLRYGIPEFRLPRKILDSELDMIKSLGVKINTDIVIGKTIPIHELSSQFDAVFLGTGAGAPNFMGIPGEDLCGVYSANEFLTRVNLMEAHKFPETGTPVKKGSKVVVIGGGNVAVDCARVALRLGSSVTLLYRRSLQEMPARAEEVMHAQEEGVDFLMLTNPSRILGQTSVDGVECCQMRLGEEDDWGRKMPVVIEGSEFVLDCDQVIIAIGQAPNPLIAKSGGIMTGGKNKIIINDNMRTSMENVFAGGDVVSGTATVINAIGDGKNAAAKIDEFLGGKKDD